MTGGLIEEESGDGSEDAVDEACPAIAVEGAAEFDCGAHGGVWRSTSEEELADADAEDLQQFRFGIFQRSCEAGGDEEVECAGSACDAGCDVNGEGSFGVAELVAVFEAGECVLEEASGAVRFLEGGPCEYATVFEGDRSKKWCGRSGRL
jgi:hypothetical protein